MNTLKNQLAIYLLFIANWLAEPLIKPREETVLSFDQAFTIANCLREAKHDAALQQTDNNSLLIPHNPLPKNPLSEEENRRVRQALAQAIVDADHQLQDAGLNAQPTSQVNV